MLQPSPSPSEARMAGPSRSRCAGSTTISPSPCISVAVAVTVGGIEVLGLMAGAFGFKGRFWAAIVTLNDNFSGLGFLIVGIFAASWIVALFIYRLKGYDGMETTRRA